MMDVMRLAETGSGLGAGTQATVGDVAAFLEKKTDDAKIEELLFAFSLVDWGKARLNKPDGGGRAIAAREYALLKLLFCDVGVEGADGRPVRPEPSLIPLLAGQRVTEACEVAKRRLQASGLDPMKIRYESDGDGQRLAGALLIPVTGIQSLKRLVLREQKKDTQ